MVVWHCTIVAAVAVAVADAAVRAGAALIAAYPWVPFHSPCEQQHNASRDKKIREQQHNALLLQLVPILTAPLSLQPLQQHPPQ